MICRRCLLRLSARRNTVAPTSRSFNQSTTAAAQAVTANTTTANNPRPHDTPAALSTSAAQPFSAGSIPGIEPEVLKSSSKKEKIKSSVPAGTVLKGINFIKGAQDPIALEDEEYPDWLWSALEQKKDTNKAEEIEGDLFAKSKKQRQRAAKAMRKAEKFRQAHPELMEPKVPLYEQSIDLPAGDGSAEGARMAERARNELTKSLRAKRRAKIKEDNFLRTM
jgi:large subunit ribosomal protein L54